MADLELWTWPTPNGRKVSILLEECGLDYDAYPVDIRRGEQLAPDFLALNPNNKIPVLRDNAPPDGGAPVVIWESGAILLYLAERTGRFIPGEMRARWAVTQWLMFQMGGVGPMHGQANHFCAYIAEPIPYARDRYRTEAERIYSVCDERLGAVPWIGGESYSIADMAIYPWAAQLDRIDMEIGRFPNLARWFEKISARPAVAAGMAVLAELTTPVRMTEEERALLFGDAQTARFKQPR